MRYMRMFFCILSLILFTGCAGMVRSGEDEVEAAREAKAAQEAVAEEMAEIEEAKQAAREKVRKEVKDSSNEASKEDAAAGSDSLAQVEETKPEDDATTQTAGQTDAVQLQEAVPQSTAKAASLRFRNKKLLDQHYNKHGIDMGFSSADEYEAAAAAVVTKPGVMHKTEAEDGDDVYYVPASNEFVVVSTDGYIRTYFLPDSGIKYYNKQ